MKVSSRVLGPVRGPKTALDRVLLKDRSLVSAAGLRPVIKSQVSLQVSLRPRHLAKCWFFLPIIATFLGRVKYHSVLYFYHKLLLTFHETYKLRIHLHSIEMYQSKHNNIFLPINIDIELHVSTPTKSSSGPQDTDPSDKVYLLHGCFLDKYL